MGLRLEQIEQTTGGEGGDAEHQVAEDLEVAADPQMRATVVVLDGAVDALGGGALVVDQVVRIRILMVRQAVRSAAISAFSAV